MTSEGQVDKRVLLSMEIRDSWLRTSLSLVLCHTEWPVTLGLAQILVDSRKEMHE